HESAESTSRRAEQRRAWLQPDRNRRRDGRGAGVDGHWYGLLSACLSHLSAIQPRPAKNPTFSLHALPGDPKKHAVELPDSTVCWGPYDDHPVDGYGQG